MSDKKSLLTESEIRRFMKLANIPAVGQEKINERAGMNQIPEHPSREYMGSPQQEGYGETEEAMMGKKKEEMDEMGSYMEEEDEAPEAGEEMPMGGEEMGAAGGDVEAIVQSALEDLAMKLKEVGIDLDVSGGGEELDLDMDDGEGEEEMSMDDAGGDEKGEEEGEEEEKEAGESAEMEEQQELQESKLVDAVLARVTARLVAEAKKKKSAEEKKKESEKKKEAMKKKAAEMKKKKKLEEANAPAPKSSMSNASAAGVAKGHGPGKKAFGTSRTEGHEWKAGKNTKGDEMGAETASAEHIVSHGKKSLATQGGNKKG